MVTLKDLRLPANAGRSSLHGECMVTSVAGISPYSSIRGIDMIALIRITTALIFSLAAGMASAQSYPNRLVKIIVPYGPAGISDIAARTIGNKLAEMWKHPVVVENRAGGAGAIGTGAVAGAAPDGYTLLVATVAEFTVTPHISRQTFNVQRDLVPVIMLTDTPLMLVANPSAPFSSVRELIAYARSKGAEVPFASPGVGTLNHLTGEYFGAAIGARMVHIPYKGGGQAVAASSSSRPGV
jgi:tripartite-type tricarboxylate transporter receptor subunit TctC